ncbi:MAG: T9SS type A sorting domain-containing protein, partial [Flavobacteriales bacterium]
YLAGNWMYAQANDYATQVLVCFSSSSDVGVEVNAQLLDATRAPIAETSYHILSTDDLSPIGGSNFVTLYFDSPYQLQAGSDYLVVLQHFGGASVMVGTSGLSIPQSSLLYRGSEATWYSISTTPMVRLEVNNFDGITENEINNGVGLGQSSPNPAMSTAQIEYSVKRTVNVTLELLDVSGKPIRTLAAGSTVPGTHKVDVDTRALAAGVYYYTLRTSDAVATKRMVVVH